MRAPGVTWFRLPLFLWSLYATSVILVLATPVLGITLVLVTVERLLCVGIFDPALGCDPVLFQHLFWFYSHPAVYIMIILGMGFDQRAGRDVLAQAALRLYVRGVRPRSPSLSPASWCGAITCSRRACRRTPRSCFRC
jgi:hypothetical protein